MMMMMMIPSGDTERLKDPKRLKVTTTLEKDPNPNSLKSASIVLKQVLNHVL